MTNSEPVPSSPASAPQPARRHRVWPWVVAAVLLAIGGCGGFFVRGMLRAKSVAEAQLGVVERVTSTWDLDVLYELGDAALRQTTPREVAQAYLQSWRDSLGLSTALKVSGYSFHSATGAPRLVLASYDAQFEHGAATVHVQFRESNGAWLIYALNVTNIVSTHPTSASPNAQSPG